MKYLSIILFITLVNYSLAQDYSEEMNRLISYAVELRSPNSDDKVYKEMLGDNCWTLMDEIMLLSPDSSECSIIMEFKMKKDMQMFGINDLAYKVEETTEGKFATAGNFCNGTDPRYNYSFIEKTIRANTTSSYEIPERSGKQLFFIVPFSTKNELKANISYGDNIYPGSKQDNGLIRIEPYANDSKDKIILTITNEGKKEISYIIINYNSRTL